MRSARGYLDALVRSARPAPRTAVHAVAQPDWGPTRLGDPGDDPAAVEVVPVTPAPRSRSRRPLAAAPASEPALDETADASPPPPATAAVPRHPEPPAVTVVRAEGPARPEPTRVSHVEERTVVHERDASAPPPVPSPPLRPARPVAEAAAPARTAAPRLPAGTEVALERLEHLARRFSAALPVEVEKPTAVASPERPAEAPAPAREVPRRPEAVVLTRPVAAAPPVAEPARVEIGSIEVYVTQPPAPAAAASVPPARVVAQPPARPERLSRPAQPFGLGQG